MRFGTHNRHILFDDFTREFAIYENNSLFKSSKTLIKLDSIDKYLAYTSKMNAFTNVYYNITKICNFKCSYCYSTNSKEYVGTNENLLVIQKLKQLNTKSITLIGGEPTCHPQFYDILNDIYKAGFDDICIVTNGYIFDFDKLKKYAGTQITFQISLDGKNEEENAPTRGKGHFDTVLSNAALLQKQNHKVRIMKVMTCNNITSSNEFYDFYKSKGFEVGFFMVKQVEDDLKPTNEQLEKLLDYIWIKEQKNVVRTLSIVNFADNMMFHNTGFPIMHCGAGINTISIMPNGDIYPCVKKEQTPYLITNIFKEDSVKTIQENRTKILSSELVIAKQNCRKCDIAYFCGGGCRAEEDIDNNICAYNCNYFRFALEYFGGKLLL